MNTKDKIALIYGASITGAGLVSYLRGRRGPDVMYDALLQGAVVGTGAVAIDYYFGSGEYAHANGIAEGNGTMPPEAIELLEEVNTDEIYAPMRRNGVKIDAVPENASIINQDGE